MAIVSIKNKAKYSTMLAGNYGDISDYWAISSYTVGTGGTSQIDFYDIPTTFTHLQLRCLPYSTTDVSDVRFRLNNDTGGNYVSHYFYGDGASIGSGSLDGANATSIGLGKTSGGVTSRGATMIVELLDYRNTNKYKILKSLHGDDGNGSGRVLLQSGSYLSTAAITSIRVYPVSGSFLEKTEISLYGIKAVS